jgi:hypothetical protein
MELFKHSSEYVYTTESNIKSMFGQNCGTAPLKQPDNCMIIAYSCAPTDLSRSNMNKEKAPISMSRLSILLFLYVYAQ